mmetsp:Transcript_63326/g.205570  ORF Transcript_63326/g.205570 Transcript_63326/m.205570 type:complete len:307 (+) Transcript_63326:684-1604(+)
MALGTGLGGSQGFGAFVLRRWWAALVRRSRPPPLTVPPAGKVAPLGASAVGDDEGDADEAAEIWQQAYALEADRHELLVEQHASLKAELKTKIPPELLGVLAEPEECALDWEGSFSKLRDCNDALDARIRGGVNAGNAAGGRRKGTGNLNWRGTPVRITVPLADKPGSISVYRRLDGMSSFYTLQVYLPLGLNVSYRYGGALIGCLIVENVLPAYSCAEGGLVEAGHILHGFTTMSNYISDEGAYASVASKRRQVLVDANKLRNVEEFVQAVSTNSFDDKILLVFEAPGNSTAARAWADMIARQPG